ncbi:hypothetical protein M405DRAFT_884176 [Rhizopogon salebrosus TDB-379]|nr:hypothetical protein M405DRAFT_884176 [Rhizopogon salebrosus TDB-379]
MGGQSQRDLEAQGGPKKTNIFRRWLNQASILATDSSDRHYLCTGYDDDHVQKGASIPTIAKHCCIHLLRKSVCCLLPPSSSTAAYPPVQFTRDDDRASGVDVDSQVTRWLQVRRRDFIRRTAYSRHWHEIKTSINTRIITSSALPAVLLSLGCDIVANKPVYSAMDWRPWIPHHAALLTCIPAFMVLYDNYTLFFTPGGIRVIFGRRFLMIAMRAALLSFATWACSMLAVLAAVLAGDGSLLLKMSATAVVAYMFLSHIQSRLPNSHSHATRTLYHRHNVGDHAGT